MKNLELSSKDSSDSSSDNTFSDLDCESTGSIYSSPRQRIEKDFLAIDRVLPFDFITHRKANNFFKEKILDIDTLLHDKDTSTKNQKANNVFEDEVE